LLAKFFSVSLREGSTLKKVFSRAKIAIEQYFLGSLLLVTLSKGNGLWV
jgi:hypothetical protein